MENVSFVRVFAVRRKNAVVSVRNCAVTAIVRLVCFLPRVLAAPPSIAVCLVGIRLRFARAFVAKSWFAGISTTRPATPGRAGLAKVSPENGIVGAAARSRPFRAIRKNSCVSVVVERPKIVGDTNVREGAAIGVPYALKSAARSWAAATIDVKHCVTPGDALRA